MTDHKILIDTAALYSSRAKNNDEYVFPSEVLNNVIKQLGLTSKPSSNEIRNSDQHVVIRTQDSSGKPELIQHPLDFVEKGIASGIEALKKRGMLDAAHVCLIAIPRGSLTSTFTN